MTNDFSKEYDLFMGILLLLAGVFIIMGGLQMIGIAMLGLTLIGAFVLSSMAIGKVVFRL